MRMIFDYKHTVQVSFSLYAVTREVETDGK